MSDRKRERAYRRLSKQLRKTQTTCCRVIPLFLLIFVASCAGVKKTNKEATTALEKINQICFSSEGRGRIEVPEGRYVFSYEAVLDQEKHRWSFAFHFPLGRQEILHLNYHPRPAADGMFYRKVASSLSRKDQMDLKSFLEFVAKIAQIKHFQKNDDQLSITNDAYSYTLRPKDSGERSPYLVLSSLGEHFERVTVLFDQGSGSQLKLLLFLTSCSES